MPASFGEEPTRGRAAARRVRDDRRRHARRRRRARGASSCRAATSTSSCDQTVTVTAGATAQVAAALDHVVDTTGVQCGDFHVHTWRSNDSDDDGDVQGAARRSPTASRCRCARITSGSATSRRRSRSSGSPKFAVGLPVDRADVDGAVGPHGRVPADTGSDAAERRRAEVADVPDGGVARHEVRDARAAGRVRRGARAARGAGRHHQPPARADELLRLRRLRPGDRHGVERTARRLGHEVHARRGVQQQRLAVEPRRQRRRTGSACSRRAARSWRSAVSDSHELSGSPVGYPRTCLRVGTDDPRAADGDRRARHARGGPRRDLAAASTSARRSARRMPGDTTTGAGSPADGRRDRAGRVVGRRHEHRDRRRRRGRRDPGDARRRRSERTRRSASTNRCR